MSEASVTIMAAVGRIPSVYGVVDPNKLFVLPPQIIRVTEETLDGKPISERYALRVYYSS